MEKLVPCLIHIPLKYPDGTDVEPERFNGFLEVFDRWFGGCSLLGTISGHWLDDGKAIVEPMARIEVSVLASLVPRFEDIAKAIGKETKQRAIYLVINWQSESRVLTLFDDDSDEEKLAIGGGA